jgi:prevent-host-death family protein
MQTVGIRELKNKLTYYLKLTKAGDNIIVTDRGAPVAIIHSLDVVEDNAVTEERLASLAKRGLIRLPAKEGNLGRSKSVKATGTPASEIIMEERK